VAMPEGPRAPLPSQDMFDRLWGGIQRARVLDGGTSGGRPLSERILLDVADPSDLQALQAVLAVRDGGDFVCRCAGELAIGLHGADDRRLAVIGLHHGVSIRWDVWGSDALLVDGEALLRWLDEHGIPEPLRHYREAEVRRHEAAAVEAAWRDAIPAPVQHLAEAFVGLSRTGGSGDALARQADGILTTAIPDEVARAGMVLRWFGAGSGRCSGYPVHEVIPETILLGTNTSVLIAALERSPDDRLLHGALRYFAGWQFNRRRAGDRTLIPRGLAADLLALAESSDDDDKRQRARRSLGR
jgi:hypothetical protein